MRELEPFSGSLGKSARVATKFFIPTCYSNSCRHENQLLTCRYGKPYIKEPDEVITGEKRHPVLIDDEVFERVQQKLSEEQTRNLHPRAKYSDYLLSGSITCAKCGKAMTGAKAKSGRHRYYACTTYLKSGRDACNAKMIPQSVFEDVVIERLQTHILTRHNIMKIVESLNAARSRESVSEKDQLQTIERELIQARQKIEKLYDAIENGNLSEVDLSPRIKERRNQITSLEQTRQAILDELSAPPLTITPVKVTELLSRLHEVLSGIDITEKKSLLRGFVKRIEVADKKITINYTIPTPVNDASAGARFVKRVEATNRPYRI